MWISHHWSQEFTKSLGPWGIFWLNPGLQSPGRILKSTKRGCHNSSNRWGHYSSGYGRSGQWWWLIGGFRYEIWPMIPLSNNLSGLKRWNQQSDDLEDPDFNNSLIEIKSSSARSLPMPLSKPTCFVAGYQTDPKEMEPDFATFFELSAHIYPSLGHILASTLSLVNRHFAGSHFSLFFCRLLLSFPYISIFWDCLGDPIRKPEQRFQNTTCWIIDLPRQSDH